MNKKNTMHLIFTIVIFILLWYMILTMNEINKNIENYNNKLEYLSQEIMNTKSDISNTINEEMSKSYITKSIDLKVKKLEKEECTIEVDIQLSKLGKNGKVFFMYKEDNDKWNEIEMTKHGELSYTCEMKIKTGNEYDYKVVTNGTISESSDVQKLTTSDYMPEQPVFNSGIRDNKEYFIEIIENSNLLNHESEKSKNKVYNSIKLKKVDIIVNEGKKDTVYKAKSVKISDADKDNSPNESQVNYEATFPKRDIGSIVYIKAKLTYNNGVEYIKDITEDITMSLQDLEK
ncbi:MULTISPECIES: hypothetical protein [unclassified Clostridioides]|uniref:hypothetical protein n=1 Tax=unclassified Clostridioides TaxID=2635829 RepID=UPI0006BBECCC|nr:hypothetical protein KW95_06645 [Clostridioides difficile]MCC0691202.1 hypothetical protein [Clostridioides sp. ZZV14-6387]MCI9975345.1 hypothetical protein [Clostridioides difficile]NJJ34102.1 hypothetical protein [Clostridioides difficile]NJK15091.1 hypothetical protein [Clostridioides difficile]